MGSTHGCTPAFAAQGISLCFLHLRAVPNCTTGFYFSFSLSYSLNQLSGFELCETESSIKRKAQKNWKQVSMLAYIAPENLKDINYPYKRPCEIYRCVCPSQEMPVSRQVSGRVAAEPWKEARLNWTHKHVLPVGIAQQSSPLEGRNTWWNEY